MSYMLKYFYTTCLQIIDKYPGMTQAEVEHFAYLHVTERCDWKLSTERNVERRFCKPVTGAVPLYRTLGPYTKLNNRLIYGGSKCSK